MGARTRAARPARRWWVLGLVCLGACGADAGADATRIIGDGSASDGGAAGEAATPQQDLVNAGAGGSAASPRTAYTPDFCRDGSIESYCGSNGCPPFGDYVEELRRNPPQELLVAPCGGSTSDAGISSDAGVAGDAGDPGARYAVVSADFGTYTTTLYYDTLSGQAVAAIRTSTPFSYCAPMYPVFGEIPAECATGPGPKPDR